MEQSLGVQVPPRVPKNRIFSRPGFDKRGVKVYIIYLSRGKTAAKGHQRAYIAQSVEHVLGKDEVIGSSPIVGSIFLK